MTLTWPQWPHVVLQLKIMLNIIKEMSVKLVTEHLELQIWLTMTILNFRTPSINLWFLVQKRKSEKNSKCRRTEGSCGSMCGFLHFSCRYLVQS